MHLNTFTLLAVAKELNVAMQQAVLQESFSQDKDELILAFHMPDQSNLFLRISCKQNFQYVFAQSSFGKAKSNVADLFPQLKDKKFRKAIAYGGERRLDLLFEGNAKLVCLMFGKQANVALLLPGRKEPVLFRSAVSEGKIIPDLVYDKERDFLERVLKSAEPIKLPFVDKHWKEEIETRTLGGKSKEEAFESLINEANSGTFFLTGLDSGEPEFWLFKPTNKTSITVNSVLEALQKFIICSLKNEGILQNKKKAVGFFSKKLKLNHSRQMEAETRLRVLETLRNEEEIGHLILASAHCIPEKAEEIELEDYYLGGTIRIKLNKELNPQQNAQRYYRKHKNRNLEITHLLQLLESSSQEIQKANQALNDLELVNDAKEFKGWQKKHNYEEISDKEMQETVKPYREFTFGGFEIWVGRNAKANDLMTTRLAHKEDLWLHASDVAGTHVIIRHKSGKIFPVAVIEYAAGLAAYFSKSKGNTLAVVQYTPKKYVRKQGKLAPGKVILERFETLLIKPPEQV